MANVCIERFQHPRLEEDVERESRQEPRITTLLNYLARSKHNASFSIELVTLPRY